MTKSFRRTLARGGAAGGGAGGRRAGGCPACSALTRVVLDKYREFEAEMRQNDTLPPGAPTRRRRMRADEVNNAFFAWQLHQEAEQEDEQGLLQWPELYRDSEDFAELKQLAKLACLDSPPIGVGASLSPLDLAQLRLSMWASVIQPTRGGGATASTS